MKIIDKDMPEYEVIRMFKEIRNNEKSKSVTPEGFCLNILKKKIGGYGIGIYGNFYVDLKLLKNN